MVYTLIDDGVNDEVVIDSPGAPNYGAWSSNAYGSDGYDVSSRLSFIIYLFFGVCCFSHRILK
jgi:hypothetical protein